MLESSLHFPYHLSIFFHFHYLSIHSLFLFHLHSTLGASSIPTTLPYISSILPSTVHHPFPSFILTFTFLSSIHMLFPCPFIILHIYFHHPFIYLILTCYPYLASLSPCHVNSSIFHPYSYILPSPFHMSLVLVIPSTSSTSYRYLFFIHSLPYLLFIPLSYPCL